MTFRLTSRLIAPAIKQLADAIAIHAHRGFGGGPACARSVLRLPADKR